MTKTQSVYTAFRDAGQGTRSVFLDHLGNKEVHAIAEGFKLAADSVVVHAQEGFGHPDRYFWPSAYLYRHALELTLKEIIRTGSMLTQLALREKSLVGHDLARFWTRARTLVVAIWPEGDQTELGPVDNVVHDLDRVDPRGDAFRYRADTKGRLHLADLPRVLSLELMAQRFGDAYSFLDGVYFGILHYLQAEQDAMAGCDQG